MKFFRLDLLTLLISLFILSGCKNEDGIGLSVDSSQEIKGTLNDTSTVKVNTVPEDSVTTSGLAKTPMGYFKDPLIGTTESNIAMGLDLPLSSAYTLPTGTITIDSVRLRLQYAAGFYGDSLSSKYKVNVYQLSSKPSSTVASSNRKVWSYNNGTVLGTLLFNARPTTKVAINAIVVGAKDTLKRVPAQIRIPISSSFINTSLFNASADKLGNNKVFQESIKGLYVTLDKTQSTGVGGTMMFALDSSSVDVYYRSDNQLTVDTTVISLPISASTHAAEIKYTYNPTVTTELANTATSRNVIYLQGLAGLRAKISFPNIKNFIKSIGSDVVLNRAELVLTPVAGTTIPFAAQPRITMYQLDLAKQRTYIQDITPGNKHYLGLTTFGGFYTTINDYHFVITGYIQDLMRGVTTVDNGAFIAPIDVLNTQTLDIGATAQTAGRVVLVGSDKSSPYRAKLNLIYTKINQ